MPGLAARIGLCLLAAAALLPAARAQPAVPGGYGDHRGQWQGPMLFFFTQDPAATAAVVPVTHPATLEIAANGSVRGQVPAAGCTLAGAAAEFVSAANATLDLDFSGCLDTRFNGRFSGRLINNPKLGYASLRLSYMRSLDSGTAQVSAILRR